MPLGNGNLPIRLTRHSLLPKPLPSVVINPVHVVAVVPASVAEISTSQIVTSAGIAYEVDGDISEVSERLWGDDYIKG